MTAEQTTIYAVYESSSSDSIHLTSSEGKRTDKQVRLTSGWDARKFFGYRTNIPLNECHFTPQEAIDAYRRRTELRRESALDIVAKADQHLQELAEIESKL